jgi:hypothetical protein
MNNRLLKALMKYSAACTLLISAFVVTSVQAAQPEGLFLFRSPLAAVPAWGGDARIIQPKILQLDGKGDLLIQCGCARFILAYNDPADRFKPSEKQQIQQSERSAAINGFSLTASLSF